MDLEHVAVEKQNTIVVMVPSAQEVEVEEVLPELSADVRHKVELGPFVEALNN